MSERIEERLRRAAQTHRKLGNHTAEVMFLEAADTIWQLRDDLQRTNDAVQDAEHDESMAWDRVRKAEAEADKLRELVADVHEALCLDKTTLFREAIIKSLEDDMRELGIEVDG